MHLVESWQRPSSDDINSDALEYLFGEKKGPASPWVSIASDPEPVARITPSYIRLQTRVEVLKGVVELTSEQLQEAHHKIGMLSAELARKDVLLTELADYRVKAAMSIVYERQNELLRRRVAELEAKLQEQPVDRQINVVLQKIEPTAETYTVTSPKFAFPYDGLNYLLVVGFAICVLITILH